MPFMQSSVISENKIDMIKMNNISLLWKMINIYIFFNNKYKAYGNFIVKPIYNTQSEK